MMFYILLIRNTKVEKMYLILKIDTIVISYLYIDACFYSTYILYYVGINI